MKLREAFIEQARVEEREYDSLDLSAELAVQRTILYNFLKVQAPLHGIALPSGLTPDMPQEALDELESNTMTDKVESEDFVKLVFMMTNDIARTATKIAAQRNDDVMTALEVERERLLLQRSLEETFDVFITDPIKKGEAVQFFLDRADRKQLTR